MTTRRQKVKPLPDDPVWYKDAVFYELRVRSFFDGNGDGIGDFEGLTQKLDYLEDLGITTLWLLPFYPSPMRDDGYDIADYRNIHPECGTLDDFRAFLRAAHERGLRVVTELVLNHTSDQHPWFQRARRAPPGSRLRDFYVWNDAPEKYGDARIIFQDFEHSNWAWDSLAKAYYWHRFYAHQPDLNFDNPSVRRAVMKTVDFWLEMGVDGLRLDAVPYLYQREGTNCENLPETHAFLRELRRHVDRKFRNRMLLAEANQWPEDAAAYLDPEECHMAFHFPIMPRMFMAVHMEDRFPVIDILTQTPSLHDRAQWALFLRNHDELTLEMVAEDERDYMYKAYAKEQRMRLNLGIRRRLAPLLGNDRRNIELMYGLLLSLPGTPVIYYGDEIGMGDNVYLGDRDGVRTPMQWSADRNAGFSRSNPQRLILPIIIDPEYHYESVNVEAGEQNRHSLLWWVRSRIAQRKQFKAFGRGAIEFLSPENHRVLAFIRSHGEERILVVANLSRFTQHAELDLARFKGMVPIELFGRSAFPRIQEPPYPVMLGPHAFYWFSIEPPRPAGVSAGEKAYEPPALRTRAGLERFFRAELAAALERVLPHYLKYCRWFGGKARAARSIQIVETLPMVDPSALRSVFLAQLEYEEGDPETYALPVGIVVGQPARDISAQRPEAILATVAPEGGGEAPEPALIVDGLADAGFCRELLSLFDRRRRMRGQRGDAAVRVTAAYEAQRGGESTLLDPRPVKVEQSNTSVIYGDRFILKFIRRIEEGINPEVELTGALTEHGFAHSPPLAGLIEYRRERRAPATMAVLQGFVPNQGDAWRYTSDELKRFFERVLTRKDLAAPPGDKTLLKCLSETAAPAVVEMMGTYLESAQLLGRRTAELHLALASRSENPDFAPEPYSALFQRAMYQSMRNLVGKNFRLLRRALPGLDEPVRALAQAVLGEEKQLLKVFEQFLKRRITITRLRCHGDFHLGQVLYTGKDFVLIDFEGEPLRSLAERRRKRSALRDVAGMIRSFHYAAMGALKRQASRGMVSERDRALLEPWANTWQACASGAYLRSYLDTAKGAPFVPREPAELEILLTSFLLEKAVYELGYELGNRPDWVELPLRGVAQLLAPKAKDAA